MVIAHIIRDEETPIGKKKKHGTHICVETLVRIASQIGLVKKWKLNTTWKDHQLLGHFWHRCNSHIPVGISDDQIRKKMHKRYTQDILVAERITIFDMIHTVWHYLFSSQSFLQFSLCSKLLEPGDVAQMVTWEIGRVLG